MGIIVAGVELKLVSIKIVIIEHCALFVFNL